MATSNKQMGDMMRKRRADMAEMPMADEPESVDNPQEEASEPSERASAFTVAAPGEPSTGDSFEYEPMIDIPGAWVVYPPGVPCDDTEYRIQMDKPAGPDDFEGMQKALDDAGANNPEPAKPTSVVTELDSDEREDY